MNKALEKLLKIEEQMMEFPKLWIELHKELLSLEDDLRETAE